MKEKWETKLEEQKRKHNLEVKQLEEKVKREQECQKQLKEEASLEYDKMSRKRDEMRERKDEMNEMRRKIWLEYEELSRKMDEVRKERDEESEKKMEKKSLRYWNTKPKRGNYKMSSGKERQRRMKCWRTTLSRSNNWKPKRDCRVRSFLIVIFFFFFVLLIHSYSSSIAILQQKLNVKICRDGDP